MRFINPKDGILSGADNQIVTGDKIDANQLISASFQAYFGDSNAAGTFKIQGSNDPCAYGNVADQFTPTNWTDIANATANITSGASALITIAQMAYRWVRAVYTPTGAGVQTVAPRADVSGNLNSKYFLLQSGGASPHLYYVWFNVNSAGVDPAVAGRTGIEVAVATNDSAATIGAAMATAIAAVNSSGDFSTSGTTTVAITNLTAGPWVQATDGTAATGFTFAKTGGGTTTVTANMMALSI